MKNTYYVQLGLLTPNLCLSDQSNYKRERCAKIFTWNNAEVIINIASVMNLLLYSNSMKVDALLPVKSPEAIVFSRISKTIFTLLLQQTQSLFLGER